MTALDDRIAKVQADVAAETAADQAAIALLQGIPALIQAAVDAALAAGATPDQLTALDTVSSTIEANTAAVVAASAPKP